MNRTKQIFLFAIALLFFKCSKKESLPDYDIPQIVQDCTENQFTDSLEIINNLIGTWDLIDYEKCKNCTDHFPPFITFKLNADQTGKYSLDEFNEERILIDFQWFIFPAGNSFSNYYFKLSSVPFLSAVNLETFCEDYMLSGYSTSGTNYLFKKRK